MSTLHSSPSSRGSNHESETVSTSRPLDRLGPARAKALRPIITAALISVGAIFALAPWTSTHADSSGDAKIQGEKIELQKREEREAREAKAREEKSRETGKNSEEKAVVSASANAAAATPQFGLQPATQPSSLNYLTAHYNSSRTGWNPNETLLNPTNVNINNTVSGAHNFSTPTAGFFGELWNSQPFGSSTTNVWAVPLYADSVTMSSGTYSGLTFSVIYCATGSCDLYALVATTMISGSTVVPAGTVLWHTNLGTANFSSSSANCGIWGTPIINLSANPPTMYVDASCSSSPYTSQTTGWLIFAVDITSGNVLPSWPVAINNTTLQPVMQNGPATYFNGGGNEGIRGALNLSLDGSILYVPISDVSTVPGFMVAVQTIGLPAVVSCFAGSPGNTNNGSDHFAGMWGADGASVDSNGYVYVLTGDDPTEGLTTYGANQDRLAGFWGMSMLVFNPVTPDNPTLTLAGEYSPWNYQSMDLNDIDIASTPVLIPDLPGNYPHSLCFGSKSGTLYFVNRDGLQHTATNQRPAAVNGVNFQSNLDETGFVDPAGYSYYTNGGVTPSGATGPINVFGPYTEDSNNTDLAKARTSPCVFQGPDNNYYLVYTGQTKTAENSSTAQPPGIARLKINTSASAKPYLSLTSNVTAGDYYDMLDNIQNAMSAVVTSNGNQNAVAWTMDENALRSAGLSGTHPYLLGLDPMTMTVLYKSAVQTKSSNQGNSTLHVGGKYNEVSVIRGKVLVGTDRLQVFGVSSYVYAIGCGGSGGPGDTTTTTSPLLANSTRNTITTTVGKTFTADSFVSGGTAAGATASAIDVTAVSNPAPQAVYQNARIGTSTTSGTGFTYTFPNLTPGATYSVRLHFCETNSSVTGTGRRKFNVTINGTQVLTNYDIFSISKGRNVACEEPFPAVADINAGTITIAFVATGSTFPPMVNGIEINAIPDSVGQEYWFDWLAQNSLLGAAASPTADAKNDGVPNVWKYFTNASPSAIGNPSKLLPQMSVVNSGGTNYLQFSVLERIDFATRGFSLAVQTSPSLIPSNWTNQSYTVVSTTPTGDGVTQTAVLQTPISPGTKSLFGRVQLTLANN